VLVLLDRVWNEDLDDWTVQVWWDEFWRWLWFGSEDS
jgi:hypothetical protein